MLRRLHILKDLSDLSQPAVTDLSNRIILKAKTNRNKNENGNSVNNKIKRVNLAEPGPSCTVPQNGEISGLCNGEMEEVNSYSVKGQFIFFFILLLRLPYCLEVEPPYDFMLIKVCPFKLG